MYPAMYQTQMMVQILGGQQANGQCPPMHPQQLHISNPNTFYPNDYVQFAPDVVGLNRHRIIQVYMLRKSSCSQIYFQKNFHSNSNFTLDNSRLATILASCCNLLIWTIRQRAIPAMACRTATIPLGIGKDEEAQRTTEVHWQCLYSRTSTIDNRATARAP